MANASPPSRDAADEQPTWPLSLAIALALACAFSGLNQVLEEPSWWFSAAGIIGAVTFAVAGVRSVTAWRGWGPIAGVATMVIALSFSFASPQSLLGFIPTVDVATRFLELVVEGAASINAQAVPAEPTPGITFLLAAGAGLLTLILDVVVIIARRPALAGLALFALLAVPSIFDGSAADAWVFVLTAASYLLLLYLSIGEARTGGAVGVAAAALAVALILPVVVPPTSVEPEDTSSGPGFLIGVNTFIALGDNLRRPSPTRVLTYETTRQGGQYLTLSSIDSFEGSQWKPEAPSDNRSFGAGGVLTMASVPGLDDGIATEESTTSIDIRSMGGRFAPVPYAPARIIGLGEDWTFVTENLTVTSAAQSARGAEYEVTSVHAEPTLQQLRAAGPVPAGFERYLAIPDRLPELVAETAAEVTAGATTAIDQAIALQSYFTGGAFEYSEQAPVAENYDGTSAQVVGRFLEERSGYCVHFSSAMAVMARTLGIPARIAVGFTPGEIDDSASEDEEADDDLTAYVVTTANLHAWPELYFDDIGWVRFEPTVGRGDVPVFRDAADPSDDPSSSASATPSSTASAAPSASASASPSPSAGGGQGGSDLGSTVVAAVTVAVLVLVAVVIMLLPFVPAVVRLSRRLRRYLQLWRGQSATAAWAELSDTAIDLGWRAEATTPREFEQLVRPGMAIGAVEALQRLRSAIELTAFSRTAESARIADVRTVRRAMRRASTRNDRMRARFSPRSVALRGWRRR